MSNKARQDTEPIVDPGIQLSSLPTKGTKARAVNADTSGRHILG